MLCLVLGLTAQDQAQNDKNWKEQLNDLTTTAADKLSNGKATGFLLAKEWHYAAPSVKFEGNDTKSQLMATLFESTIVEQLEKLYTMAGLKKGTGSLTFSRDGKFKASNQSHAIEGRYTYDPATHLITVSVPKKSSRFDLSKLNPSQQTEKVEAEPETLSMSGNVYVEGDKLKLLFPFNKIIEMADKLDTNQQLEKYKTLIDIIKSYKNIYIGFEFSSRPVSAE